MDCVFSYYQTSSHQILPLISNGQTWSHHSHTWNFFLCIISFLTMLNFICSFYWQVSQSWKIFLQFLWVSPCLYWLESSANIITSLSSHFQVINTCNEQHHVLDSWPPFSASTSLSFLYSISCLLPISYHPMTVPLCCNCSTFLKAFGVRHDLKL